MASAGIHEVVLVVRSIESAVRFYRDVVGLILRSKPTDDWASFATISPDKPQWLGLHKGALLYEEHSPRPEGDRFGPVHFALEAREPSPEEFLARAREHGVQVYGPEEWDGRMTGRSYYCYDPDDNLFEYWYPDQRSAPSHPSGANRAMIQGLFETHINVSDLDRSMAFYCGVLGLEAGRREDERRVGFLWLGGKGEAMLGLWEKPRDQIVPQHFAFRAGIDDVINGSVAWLRQRGLACHNFLKDGTERPMVFAWMPAVSIYFRDPDGHSLEMIAMLPDAPRPELGVLSWEDWNRRR